MSNVIDARARFEARARAEAEHDIRLELFDWLDYGVDVLGPGGPPLVEPPALLPTRS